jgi:hypothetical protein
MRYSEQGFSLGLSMKHLRDGDERTSGQEWFVAL